MCNIMEYDGAYKCFEHKKNWGAIMDADPCLSALQDRIRELEQENARLRAELEQKKLKWQRGTIPEHGYYWAWLSNIKHQLYYYKGMQPAHKWAGPILPPESEVYGGTVPLRPPGDPASLAQAEADLRVQHGGFVS